MVKDVAHSYLFQFFFHLLVFKSTKACCGCACRGFNSAFFVVVVFLCTRINGSFVQSTARLKPGTQTLKRQIETISRHCERLKANFRESHAMCVSASHKKFARQKHRLLHQQATCRAPQRCMGRIHRGRYCRTSWQVDINAS